MKYLPGACLCAALAPQAAQAPPQTFRSATQVVEVDVRVFDDARFVGDLKAADFEVTEDGVPQTIRSVLVVRAMAGAPGGGAGSVASGAALPPPGAPPQVWVFLFDTPHLTAGTLQRTREAVETFIDQRFRQGDTGGVVVDGRMVNNRLTSDREELRRAAASVKAPGELRSRQLELREWPRLQDESEAFRIASNDRDALQRAVARACVDDPDQCKMASPDVQVRSKAQQLVREYRTATLQTLTTVDTLANGLARIPGAKTIVFISEGFVLQDQEAQLRQAVGQAARAGAHFYAIDARGLNKGSNAGIIDQRLADNPMGAPPTFDAQADGPNSLAIDTGGFAIRNQNNIGRALDDIQKDAGTYYVLGYSPTNNEFDGKYRTISVTVKRPGVVVRARRGYLALAPAALVRPTPARDAGVVSPKPPDDSAAAKAAALKPADDPVPATTAAVSPKPPDDPAAAKADSMTPTPSGASNVPIRARIDTGKMVLALGKDSAANTAGSAQLGWEAYEKGDVETAARHLTEAAKAPDARAWIPYVLGLSQFALRQYQEASESWERVRRDAPEFEPIYFSLADAYSLRHEEGTAIRMLRDAQQRWPADPEVANAIGVIQVRRGALDAAIESFERATTIAPADALGYFNLARTHQMRLLKSQRYDRLREKWIGADDDRRRAIANFNKYLELGGPYERQAKEALASLAWK
jgi:VWFA-related protein